MNAKNKKNKVNKKQKVTLDPNKRDSPVADTELIPVEHRSQYREIRVVPKIDLYNFSNEEDVDMDRYVEVPGPSMAYQPKRNFPSGLSWTSWQQAGSYEGTAQQFRQNNLFRKLPKKTNMQKTLEKALKAPADNMTKAEIMMQKMGWKGGALGKDENGILEPIAPDATYAVCTLGFGQKIADEKPKPLKLKKPVKPVKTLAESINRVGKKMTKEHFFTNILQIILGFVRNDREIEIAFDAKLTRNERLRVHKVVGDAINCNDMEIFNYDNNLMDMVQEINKYNQYILKTESENLEKGRQLSLFKEEPEHVFMVTPLDLNPKKDEVEKDTNENKNNDNLNTKTNVNEELDDSQTNASKNNSQDDSNSRVNDIESNETSDDLKTVNNSENNDAQHTTNDTVMKKDYECNDKSDSKSNVIKDIEKAIDLTKSNDSETVYNSDVQLVINGALMKDDNQSNDIKSDSKTDGMKDTEMAIDETVTLEENDKEIFVCDCCEKPREMYIIIGYFLDFAYDENYTEFRFLGPFNDFEENVISFFMADVDCLIRGKTEGLCVKYEKAADLGPFEIREDCNGSQVIHKVINDIDENS